ncbi:hypothetical protein BU16DRAFT_253527 [Lophium mytilinum]|uniref:Uncharacterized protein n=1 Tax=Lophium mytilinum TaxID=390894 RepID=A0A6A6R734_9PEZI|nr:hypothetical protein BU16DRAFT_253527 [Lophium mytilinum]
MLSGLLVSWRALLADGRAKAALFAAGGHGGAGENMASCFKMLHLVGKATRDPVTFLCCGSTRQQSAVPITARPFQHFVTFVEFRVRCAKQTDGLSASLSIASPVVELTLFARPAPPMLQSDMQPDISSCRSSAGCRSRLHSSIYCRNADARALTLCSSVYCSAINNIICDR